MFRRSLRLIPLFVALAGCAPGNPGLVIANVISPDDQGLYTIGNPAFSQGTYDVSARFSNVAYTVRFRALNQLIDLGNNGTSGVPAANPNLVSVQEGEIELRDVGGAPLGLGLANPFRVPASGTVIPSSDGTSAGEAIIAMELIPLVYRDALVASAGTTVVVSVRAIGQTSGGAELVSPEFVFPIQICDGCLSICMVEDMDPVCRVSPTPGQDVAQFSCDGTALMGDPPCGF